MDAADANANSTLAKPGGGHGDESLGSGLGTVNGVSAMATVVARFDNESAVVERATVEARAHYRSGPLKRPTFVVDGVARFVYPCTSGTSIVVKARVSVDMGVLAFNASASLSVPCGGDPAQDPVGIVTVNVENLDIEGVTVSDVEIVASVYNRPAEGFSLVGSIKGKIHVAFAASAAALGKSSWKEATTSYGENFEGAAAAAALGIRGELGAEVTFTFDTFRNTFRAAVDMGMNLGPLDLRLTASVSTANNCDMDNGDFITGNATLSFSDVALVAGVSGVRHCGVNHTLHMRNMTKASASDGDGDGDGDDSSSSSSSSSKKKFRPVPVAPRYAEALLDILAPVGSADRFPRCTDKSGLCGPWFGGRVCGAGQYCSPQAGRCKPNSVDLTHELLKGVCFQIVKTFN